VGGNTKEDTMKYKERTKEMNSKKQKFKKSPRIVRRGQLKCFHNGIILIVICFKNCTAKIYILYLSFKYFVA
jgi:hypothetical protein